MMTSRVWPTSSAGVSRRVCARTLPVSSTTPPATFVPPTSTPMVSVTAAAPLCCAVRPRPRPTAGPRSECPALRRRRPMLPRRRHRAPARRAPRDGWSVPARSPTRPRRRVVRRPGRVGPPSGWRPTRRPAPAPAENHARYGWHRATRGRPGRAGRGARGGSGSTSSVFAVGAGAAVAVGSAAGPVGLGAADSAGRTRGAGWRRPAARSPAPVASRSANSGLGSRNAAMHPADRADAAFGEPVAKAPPAPERSPGAVL